MFDGKPWRGGRHMVMQRWLIHRWERLADQSHRVDLHDLRRNAQDARQINRAARRLLHSADRRLSGPPIGAETFPHPPAADWNWRPDAFHSALETPGAAIVKNADPIGTQLRVFHGEGQAELTYRQVRNHGALDLAPFGLRFDIYRSGANFVSLAVDLPTEAVQGLTKRHLIKFSFVVDFEYQVPTHARLNIRHGPNQEQSSVHIEWAADSYCVVEFDLGYMTFNENRVEKLWLDLIFSQPEMNQITIRDMTFSRIPRADL